MNFAIGDRVIINGDTQTSVGHNGQHGTITQTFFNGFVIFVIELDDGIAISRTAKKLKPEPKREDAA